MVYNGGGCSSCFYCYFFMLFILRLYLKNLGNKMNVIAFIFVTIILYVCGLLCRARFLTLVK